MVTPECPVEMGGSSALKHGLYTDDAVAERRELAALIRTMRELVEEIGGQG